MLDPRLLKQVWTWLDYRLDSRRAAVAMLCAANAGLWKLGYTPPPANYVDIMLYAAVNTAVFSAWYARRHGWILGSTWVLALAVDADPKARRHLASLIRQLRCRLAQVRLTRRCRIIEISPELIGQTQDAERWVDRGKADVVLWAPFQCGTKDGEQAYLLYPPNFTVRLNPFMKANLQRFTTELQLVLNRTSWIIHERDTLRDIARSADGLVQCGLYIAAVHALTEENWNDAVQVAHYLLRAYRPAGSERTTKGSKFDNAVAMIGAEASLLLANQALEACQFKLATSHYQNIKHMFGGTGFHLELNLARCAYELHDVPTARRHTEAMRSLDPYNPLLAVNEGFLCIMDGRYAEALDSYNAIWTLRELGTNPVDLSEFLGRQTAAVPNEPALYFALGVVGRFGDKQKAIEDFRRFIRLSASNGEQLCLRNRAEQMLRELLDQVKADSRSSTRPRKSDRRTASSPSRKRRRRR